jgi:hypothetical protein
VARVFSKRIKSAVAFKIQSISRILLSASIVLKALRNKRSKPKPTKTNPMKTIKSLLAVALVAVSASYVSAQESSPVENTRAFAGEVTAISETSVSVKTDTGDKTVAIDSGTSFVDATGVAVIKVGQQIAIRSDAAETKAILIRGKWPME